MGLKILMNGIMKISLTLLKLLKIAKNVSNYQKVNLLKNYVIVKIAVKELKISSVKSVIKVFHLTKISKDTLKIFIVK